MPDGMPVTWGGLGLASGQLRTGKFITGQSHAGCRAKKGPSSEQALQKLQRVRVRLACRVPATVFLVFTVGFAVAAIIDAVVTDLGFTACLTYLSAAICHFVPDTMTCISVSRMQSINRHQGRPVLELITLWCSG